MSPGASILAWAALTLLAAALWSAIVVSLTRVWLFLPRLDAVPPDPPGGRWPRVSVVVPSRDEAEAIEAAAQSLLVQDYPELELIAVDDRSSDGTGAILDRLAAADRRLGVVHVDALPEDWLGKNHACHRGAERATGEWLLFTAGDVVFAPGALRRVAGWRRVGATCARPRSP